MGFADDQIFDITLAVEEAYTNAVEHCGKNRVNVEIEIEFFEFEDRLEVLVQDSGCGFQKDFPLNRSFRDLSESIRGRGLGLIKKLSDKIEIVSKPGTGTSIRIVKFLSSATKETQ